LVVICLLVQDAHRRANLSVGPSGIVG